jgi:hypothetical protein
MKLRFLSAAVFFVALGIASVTPNRVERLDASDCLFIPGDVCSWECTIPCEVGCCGSWQRWAWS